MSAYTRLGCFHKPVGRKPTGICARQSSHCWVSRAEAVAPGTADSKAASSPRGPYFLARPQQHGQFKEFFPRPLSPLALRSFSGQPYARHLSVGTSWGPAEWRLGWLEWVRRRGFTAHLHERRCWCRQRSHGAAPSARLGDSSLRDHAGPAQLVLTGGVLPNLGHGHGTGAMTRLSYAGESVGRGGWGLGGEPNTAPSEKLFQNGFYQTFLQLVKETESRRRDLRK